MRYKALKNCPMNAGFTLIEIALVIMISGFTMLMAANFVKIYTINLKHEKTVENLGVSQDALNEFIGLYGRYPCPADPTLVSGDGNYGLEQCRSTAILASNADDCAGTPGNIACTTDFSRDGDLNSSDDVIMIGILPFRTLAQNIVDTPFTESNRLDGYSIHLSYAVTEHMSDRNKHDVFHPANPNSGGIRVEDENQLSIITAEDSAHYVLFSHGDNGKGGYTTAGSMVDDCMVASMGGPPPPPPSIPAPGPSGAGIDVEIENCDNNDAIFVKGIRSLADNSSYNDDILVFKATGLWALWRRSLASPDGESYIFNTNMGHVGVGTETPTHDLHVVGDLSAEVSTIAIRYCDGVGTDCLEPEAIAGAGSQCLDGAGNPDYTKIAYAVQDNRLVCRDANWTMPMTNCPIIDVSGTPTQTFISGFSNIGNALCCTQYGNHCCKHEGLTGACALIP